MNQEALRRIPQLEKLLHAVGDFPGVPRVLLTQLVREQLERIRAQAHAGTVPADFETITAQVRSQITSFSQSRLRPVINGTGVLIHTNLGRSPMAPDIAETLKDISINYSNLELDLESGDRGKRGRFLEKSLALLCGAEAATVVNNCASALVLILRHLTTPDRREVVISRGQLVEIGGGFRVPEIMETSGALMREVGTTNKTTLHDYKHATNPATAMYLRVHRSNFYMEGFVAEPSTEELVALGKQQKISVVEDLGSGAVLPTEELAAIEHETTPAALIAAGVDLVCFSGDKLFGGPQAGIIVGKASLIAGLKKDPFFRALRCDKMVMGVLQECALRYLHHMGEGRNPVSTPLPLLEMLQLPLTDLQQRADRLIAALADLPVEASAVPCQSRPGGGTMPRSQLPSIALRLRAKNLPTETFSERMRTGSIAVVGFIEGDALHLDLRTVFPRQDDSLAMAIRRAITGSS
jgi:L-seryl-tRNA(Ser) seleniumtransferase